MIVIIGVQLYSANAVWAGRGRHGRDHYWKAAAIGLGAALVGSAIANACQPQHVTVIEHHAYYPPCPPRYCEPRWVWIPPVTETVWNPGHYEYGRWVPGQYITIVREPGYWAEERICRDYR